MIRIVSATLAILSLFACVTATQAFQGASRAPAHPSQSQPAVIPPERQIEISEENRRQVEDNLRQQLDQIGAQFAVGKTPMPDFSSVIATLQPGGDHQFRVMLRDATAYTFIAACDADCNDVDVELLRASDGLVVGSDLLRDDYPVVNYTPTANGNFYVRVILKTCTQAPCYVAARVLQ